MTKYLKTQQGKSIGNSRGWCQAEMSNAMRNWRVLKTAHLLTVSHNNSGLYIILDEEKDLPIHL